MFGRLFKNAKKVANQNTLEAIIAATMLVAAADGTVERSEMDKLDKLLTSNENLNAFKPAEIRKLMQRYQTMLEADFLVGKQKMMKEISDISDNTEISEEVFLNALAISKADGEIEPEEAKVLQEIGRFLGINAQEYGIQAAA